MLLENSHRHEELQSTYCQLDVDRYCSNNQEATFVKSGMKTDASTLPERIRLWEKLWPERVKGGAYSEDPVATRQELGSRWLSTNYKAGDVLIFHMKTMHAALDNQTRQLRISSDSRYQLASETIDERWVGEVPIGHGPGAKKEMIC